MIPQLIDNLSTHDQRQKMVEYAYKNYNVYLYKVNKFSSQQIFLMYNTLVKKNYPRSQNNQFWFENQLKIFIWILLAYSYFYKKRIQNFTLSDWQNFSLSFNHRSLQFFEFQAKFILKSQKTGKLWCEQEVQILKNIIEQHGINGKWNFIARQMFGISQKKYFKTPKQCREQWLNHLDPCKNRQKWDLKQDLKLIKLVKSIGKRWAYISKVFKNTRTEHMIKNRYNSIIKSYAKNYKKIRQEKIIQKFLAANDCSNLRIDLYAKKNSIKSKKPQTLMIDKELKASAICKNFLTKTKNIRIKKQGKMQLKIQEIEESQSLKFQNMQINSEMKQEQIGIKQFNKQKQSLIQEGRLFGSKITRMQIEQGCCPSFFQEVDQLQENISMAQEYNLQSFISQCMKTPFLNIFQQQSQLKIKNNCQDEKQLMFTKQRQGNLFQSNQLQIIEN